MQLDPRTPLIVVSGNQGAGKSTVSRLLAQRFARGAHVEADVLHKMIVSGGEWPQPPAPAGEAARQLRLRLHNACLLARSFVDAGIASVVDDIIAGDRLDQLLEELTGRDVIFVMLVPDVAAIRAREHARGTALFDEWSGLDTEIRTNTRRIGLWLDTSSQTPQQTVDEIMRRAWSEGAVHT